MRQITKIEVTHNHAGTPKHILVYRAGRVPRLYAYTTLREFKIKMNSHVFRTTREQRITTYMIH